MVVAASAQVVVVGDDEVACSHRRHRAFASPKLDLKFAVVVFLACPSITPSTPNNLRKNAL